MLYTVSWKISLVVVFQLMKPFATTLAAMVAVIDFPEEPKMYMSSPPIGTPEPNILSPAYALVKIGGYIVSIWMMPFVKNIKIFVYK